MDGGSIHAPPVVAAPVTLSTSGFDLIARGIAGLWERLVADNPAADDRPLLLSYDVHPTPDGPRLIEINTNAGGVLSAIEAARTVNQCCAGWEQRLLRQRLLQLLKRDLTGAGGRVAIVDDHLAEQALLPEMHGLATLMRDNGVRVDVADASQLELTDGRLMLGGEPVQHIYWRSTDFDLSAPEHAATRQAWDAGAVSLAPSPLAWAAIADKQRLVELSRRPILARDDDGLSFEIASTVPLDTQPAEAWYAQRRGWVFKPASGHASKGVYVGKRISRSKLQSLMGHGYLAQRYAPHPAVDRDGEAWKYDLRFFADRGQVIGVCARVFQGQVVGMRAAGSGIASVQIDDRCCVLRSLASALSAS